MPTPKKTSQSPGRAKARGRSKSASRTKTRSRSRSHSAGRKPKPNVSEVEQVKVVQAVVKKSPGRKKSKSPSRVAKDVILTKQTARVAKDVILSKQTITSAVYSSVVSSSLSSSASAVQERPSVTPVRSSLRMIPLKDEHKSEVTYRRQQVNSETSSNIRATPAKEQPKAERTKPHYEFMGPVGTFLLLFLLPLTAYFINMTCSKGKCSILEVPKLSKKVIASLFQVEATLIFLGWFFFQAFLACLPVGPVIEGQPLKSGGRLRYRCNGFFALVVSLVLLGVAVYFQCPVTKVIDKFLPLMTTAIIFSFILSIFLYVRSRYISPSRLATGGNTGNVIYDFFIGRELNPRIGPLDLKFFCELRPGLIGWVVLDVLMVVKAYQETGTVSPNLVLVTLFQTLYVADALWFEDAVLTTMDIIHDGFGFMLAFGDLVWVPFLYSLQPRFLLDSKFALPWYCLAPIVLMNFVGFAVFRLSNLQKNRFRNDPKHPAVADLETIPTPTKKLLVSGWWGICRKPNYLGDLIMGLSWSLTTGFGQILTYFYPIYFLILLIHRERRDSEQCRNKYGRSWDQYCERVKYRIFPYIY